MSRASACSRCGAVPDLPGASFCGHCGAPLTIAPPAATRRRYHGPPRLQLRGRPALSCPECGEPMRFGFRHVCRNCGAELCLLPMVFHPNHMRVYVKGFRAAGEMLLYDIVWYSIGIGVLALISLGLKRHAISKAPPIAHHAATVALDRFARADLPSVVKVAAPEHERNS